jgi:hypothetical protein
LCDWHFAAQLSIARPMLVGKLRVELSYTLRQPSVGKLAIPGFQ